MTLKQLELFLAIADSHSFSRGAAAVSLVQSTASQHVRSLEEELGSKLFDRTRHGVQLTAAGELFAAYARRICLACSDARMAMRRFRGAEEAILRVGASTIPASCQIPDALGHFTAAWPGVRLELAQGDSREVLRLLQAEAVELAVVGGQFAGEGIAYQELGSERIQLIARPGQGLPAIISLAQLQALPLVVREPGSGTRLAVDRALLQAGLEPDSLRAVAQLGSSEAVRRAVLGGAGCAFMSTLAVDLELADRSLVAVDIAGIEIRRSFYLAWRKGRSLSPAALAFMEVLEKAPLDAIMT